MQLLEYLRSRPQVVRTRYAFFFAAFVTGLITVIWVTTLPAQFAEVDTKQIADDVSRDELKQFVSQEKMLPTEEVPPTSVRDDLAAARLLDNQGREETRNLDALIMQQPMNTATTTVTPTIVPEPVTIKVGSDFGIMATSTGAPIVDTFTKSPIVPKPESSIILIATSTTPQ